MDFVAIFFLLIPLISLYIRAPVEFVTAEMAWTNLGEVVGLSALYLVAGLVVFRLYVARQESKAAHRKEGLLKIGRANNFFTYGLAALFYAHVHWLTLKESFERLFFSSEWFILSDVVLLLPFLAPFILFRAYTGRVALRLRGTKASYGREVGRQVRSTAVLLVPQLLYLNLYRTIVQDIPGLDAWFGEYPMFGFVVAGTLLFILFVLSPYFIRLLFTRVRLHRYPGGEELAPQLQALARRSGVALDRVYVWLTGDRRIANAAVSGLFRRQRAVFLTDHLLQSLSPAEVVAVVAHELGHTRFLHLFFNFLLAIMSGVFVIWGLVVLSPSIETQEGLGMAVLGLEVVYIFFVFGGAARRFERQADLYAAWVTGSPNLVASALLKLAVANHVSTKRGSITHPSIHARIRRLGRLSKRFGPDFTPPVRRARRENLVMALSLVGLFVFTLFRLGSLNL